MPRARNVKPAFFKNEELVELPFEDRLLFIGLWTLSDCRGVLEDRPKRIKMEIFPADNVDVCAALDRLHVAGLIVRYEAGGRRGIHIPKFTTHQNPHHREQPIDFPEPSVEPEASPRPALGQPRSSPAESLLLNPESPIPESPKPARKRAGYSDEFEAWWGEYPNRKGKAAAFKAWKRLAPDDRQAATDDVPRRLALDRQWKRDGGVYIPHGSTYLNQRGWEDDITPETANEAHQRTGRRESPAERTRRLIAERRAAEGRERSGPLG